MKSFFSSSKKAQGLSLNLIIVAVLGLIVLVIIILAITGKFGSFNKGLADCSSKGGICRDYNDKSPIESCLDTESKSLSSTNCQNVEEGKTKQVCCIAME
ncbi:hypothetical protein HN587_06530 [Candidatus Woesearchaeota archaeon]|jgi:hypothetical protein|nr:hypothetical protein [Candidatus Woesearchaeota archaeon]